MPKLLRNDASMSFADFEAFLESRPPHERWELIDAVAVMNPTPLKRHQRVVTNLVFALERTRREVAGTWSVLPGLGVRIPGRLGRAVVPDVVIVPPGDEGSSWALAPIVAFEVLSPSTRRTDLVWKPQAYRDLPSLQHLVLVDPDQPWVRAFDRTQRWADRILTSTSDRLALSAVHVELPLAEIYRDIDFDDSDEV
jgi:Uma2 family endonuclease